MSPLPRVRPLPAIPLLTSHPFAFTLSNLTAHFSSLTPSSSRHPGVASRDPAATTALRAPPVHGEPVEPHPRGEPAPDAIRGGDPAASNHPAAPSAHGEPFEPHPVHAAPRDPQTSDSPAHGEPVEPHPTVPSTTPAKAPIHARPLRTPKSPEKRPPAPEEFFRKNSSAHKTTPKPPPPTTRPNAQPSAPSASSRDNPPANFSHGPVPNGAKPSVRHRPNPR